MDLEKIGPQNGDFEIKVVVLGKVLSKKNSKRSFDVGGVNVKRRRVVLPSKEYKRWEPKARAEVLAQLPTGFKPFDSPIEVRALYFWKQHRPDLSGMLESVGDAFESVLWTNDKLIKSWDGSRVIHDVKNPRVEIYVRRLQVES